VCVRSFIILTTLLFRKIIGSCCGCVWGGGEYFTISMRVEN
jgi:hypothetical protein